MSEADDQLVAIAHAFSRSAPDLAVRALTGDSGVMGRADMLGLDLAEIPENWLLPPESDRNERTIRRLVDELARYKGAEPRFGIKYSRPDKTSSEGPIELTIVRYKSLKESERLSLMERLKEHVPEVSDFGPAKQKPKNIRSLGFMDIWEPVSEKERRAKAPSVICTRSPGFR
jgi:hypothetical protein